MLITRVQMEQPRGIGAPVQAVLWLEGESCQGQHGQRITGRDDCEESGILNGLLQVHGHRVAVLHDLGVARAAQTQKLVVLGNNLRCSLGEVEREVNLISTPAQHASRSSAAEYLLSQLWPSHGSSASYGIPWGGNGSAGP